jgi:hypothetical protein
MRLEKEKVAISGESLEILQMEETCNVARAVTGDESWLSLNYFHPHLWSVPYDERPFASINRAQGICSLSFRP